jgi:hypothetical protein
MAVALQTGLQESVSFTLDRKEAEVLIRSIEHYIYKNLRDSDDGISCNGCIMATDENMHLRTNEMGDWTGKCKFCRRVPINGIPEFNDNYSRQ